MRNFLSFSPNLFFLPVPGFLTLRLDLGEVYIPELTGVSEFAVRLKVSKKLVTVMILGSKFVRLEFFKIKFRKTWSYLMNFPSLKLFFFFFRFAKGLEGFYFCQMGKKSLLLSLCLILLNVRPLLV